MTPRSILVAVAAAPEDDRALAAHLVEEAVAYAAAFGARVTLVHVEVTRVPFTGQPFGAPAAAFAAMDELHAGRRAAALAALTELQTRAATKGVAVDVEVVDGVNAGEAIATTARERGADLVVVCSHGRRGVKRLLLGSVADRVVHTAAVPVLVLPPPA